MTENWFHGKCALVTGGAQGIGRGIVRAFVQAGARVVIADLFPEKAEDLVKEHPGQVRAVKTDLSKAEDISNLLERTQEAFGRLDFVVNNARPKLERTPQPAPVDQTLLDGWTTGIDVLLKAPALVVKSALPLLRKSETPSVVNIVSTNALFIAPQPMVYHVAKAGLIQMTRYLAYVLGPERIRVNSLGPGIVDVMDTPRPLTTVPVNKATADIAVPLKRAATVEDIAQSVLYFCSPASAYVTGQTLLLDGGITLGDQFHVTRQALQSQGFV